MTDETFELIKDNISFDVSREELDEILDAAENLGYYDGEYSNNPGSLFAFIDGYMSKD